MGWSSGCECRTVHNFSLFQHVVQSVAFGVLEVRKMGYIAFRAVPWQRQTYSAPRTSAT